MMGNNAPDRPSGSPKPLRHEDLAPVLARLDSWYSANLPPDQYTFNPPAKDEELEELERLVGVELPCTYRQLYRWHDGENGDRCGHIYGMPLLPLARVVREWQCWSDVLADFGGNRYAITAGAWPEGSIDPAYINPCWIALTADGSGNHIGLDLDPWPGGRMGQIILFGRDEDVKVVLADSLGRFLEWVADLLEGGNFRLDVETGVPLLRDFRLLEPPSDHFHDGARTLLGAPSPYGCVTS